MPRQVRVEVTHLTLIECYIQFLFLLQKMTVDRCLQRIRCSSYSDSSTQQEGIIMSISVGASSIVHRGILTPSPTVPLVPFPSCVRRGSVQESSYPSSGQLPVPAPSIHVSTWIRDGFLHVRSLCLSCALTGSSRGEMKASPLIISDGTWF